MTSRPNAFWFFVAFLGGGAAIWWIKSVVANAWFAAMVAAGVVLALMTYYLLNDEDAPEEEGDNLYYLGLLFTLISLMFTLVELFGADSGAFRNAENIRVLLENFGIALTSTVVGIAGRVALQNWQRAGFPGTSDLDAGARGRAPARLPPPGASAQDLEGFNREVLGRIARDLTQGANALARFHRIVRSHASDSEDYLRNHSETLKRESAEFQVVLQRNAATFAQDLKSQAEGTFKAVGGSLSALMQQTDDVLARIQSANHGYLADLRETTRSFQEEFRSASGQSSEALRGTFEAAAREAEILPERLRSAHEGYVAAVRETTRSFHDEIQFATRQNLDALRQSFDAAAAQSLAVVQNMSNIDEQIGEAFDRLKSGLANASDASAAFGDSAHRAANSTAVLKSEAERLGATFGDSAEQAANSTAVLRSEAERLGGLLEPLRTSTEAVAGVLNSMQEIDERIRTGRDTEQTAVAVRQIGESLKTITDEGATATNHAVKAAESLDTLLQSIQMAEGETRRAVEALGDLASGAELVAETLRKRESPRRPFWNR
ncbi:MAG: hypothetical protein OXP09_00305 [Gammaproteobacteria bacterium]|nr:hypothetical protein [Gammaproteobacteria bacterium]